MNGNGGNGCGKSAIPVPKRHTALCYSISNGLEILPYNKIKKSTSALNVRQVGLKTMLHPTRQLV